MDLGVRGKVAMIAASSKGIGKACAAALAAEGCRVSICGRDEKTVKTAIATIDGDVHGYAVDVSKPDDLQRWFERTNQEMGHPQILVTNTGGPPAGLYTQMTDDQWREGIDSTLMNVVRLVRLVSPSMIERGWGRIVHITSLVAKEPNPLLPISSTIRSGLMALTRLQGTELASHGITVNAVLPGHTRTDRQIHLAEVRAQRESITVEQALQRQAEAVPVKRLAEPEEIAAAVAFLASQKASYITGVNLLVDGGVTRGMG